VPVLISLLFSSAKVKSVLEVPADVECERGEDDVFISSNLIELKVCVCCSWRNITERVGE
jgi:hypothetical protein